MESIRDLEDDAGPVLTLELAGAATYGTNYSNQTTN